MAYSEALSEGIRDVLGPRADLSERKMFGGIAFMLGGHVACGVIGEDLPMKTTIFVAAEVGGAKAALSTYSPTCGRKPTGRDYAACSRRASSPPAPRRTIEDLGGTIEPYLVRRAKRQAEILSLEDDHQRERSVVLAS